jgi:hypothetical protein
MGAGGFVGAALLAGLMTGVGGGDTATSVGAALDNAAGRGITQADRTRARNEAKKGREAQVWRRLRLRRLRQTARRELRCADQSFGEVRRFFLQHPCRKLDQKLALVSDPDGNLIVVSIVWVRMGSRNDAARFKKLEDTYGSGDVTPIATQALELGGIRFTGRHYASRRDSSLVVIAETEPVRGDPSDTLLKDIADVVDVLPPL